jgi:hypothetical protein
LKVLSTSELTENGVTFLIMELCMSKTNAHFDGGFQVVLRNGTRGKTGITAKDCCSVNYDVGSLTFTQSDGTVAKFKTNEIERIGLTI